MNRNGIGVCLTVIYFGVACAPSAPTTQPQKIERPTQPVTTQGTNSADDGMMPVAPVKDAATDNYPIGTASRRDAEAPTSLPTRSSIVTEQWLEDFVLKTPPEGASHVFAPISAVFINHDTSVISMDMNGYITRWHIEETSVRSQHLDFQPRRTRRGWINPSYGNLVSVSENGFFAALRSGVVCVDFAAQTHRWYHPSMPDDDRHITVSNDGTLLFGGGVEHETEVWGMVKLPEGCGLDGARTLTNMDSALPQMKNGKLTRAAFDNHGTYLAMANSHGVIFVWERSLMQFSSPVRPQVNPTPKPPPLKPTTILGPTPKAVSNMVFGPEHMLLAGYFDGRVIVWDVKKKKKIAKFRMTNTYPTLVAFSTDKNWVAAGGADGSLWVWDRAGKLVNRELNAHSYRITGLDFSADGRLLLTASIDGSFAIWKQTNSPGETKFFRARAWGEKRGPQSETETDKACGIVASEIKKALFYLTESEKRTVSAALLYEMFEDDQKLLDGLQCVRNENGSAWGIVPHDVHSGASELKVWLLYVDTKGNRYYGGRHKYWSGGNYGLSLDKRLFFDFNGDGVKEVIWTSEYWDKEDYSSDESESELHIKTFKNGSIVNYRHRQRARNVADIDSDGLPDLVLAPFSTVDISSCGHSHIATHPVGPLRVAFATGDGEFSTTGVRAVNYYRKRCPSNSPISKGVVKGDIIDNSQLRENIACAVIWGRSSSEIQKEIVSFCQGREIEDRCMDSIWFEREHKGCLGVKHLLEIAEASPVLVLTPIKN